MDDMTCKSVQNSLWDYMAASSRKGGSPRATRGDIMLHLDICRKCELHGAEVRSLRSGLRHLPARHVPPILNTRLRVLASRERARLLTHRDLGSRLRDLGSNLRLWFDNLLKPFAVPAAGGILASFLCFGVIVDTLHVVPDWTNDIPIGLYTDVTIDEPSPFTHNGPDVMVQLTVDSDGNVTDYELPQGHNASIEEMQEIGNLAFFTTFTPAKRLGQAVSSKRLFYIHHMSIKG